MDLSHSYAELKTQHFFWLTFYKKWKNQQIKRYANFRKFINNLQNSNDYYFLLYIINETFALEYKKALEDNGLMEKTIVFSHEEKYLELFKNKVLINIDFELDISKKRSNMVVSTFSR